MLGCIHRWRRDDAGTPLLCADLFRRGNEIQAPSYAQKLVHGFTAKVVSGWEMHSSENTCGGNDSLEDGEVNCFRGLHIELSFGCFGWVIKFSGMASLVTIGCL